METEFTMITPQLDAMVKADVLHIVEEMPWMKGKKFILMHQRQDIEAYIDRLIKQGIAVLDLETTGLNGRMYNGESADKIVGFCLAPSRDEGVYIPIAHRKDDNQESEYNVSLPFMLEQLKKLAANCVLIFHNFKFDGAFLKNYGVLIGGDSKDEAMYEDTLIMAVIQDASRKNNQLKHLSKTLLGREMLEIKGLGVVVSDDSIPAFDEVPPEKAVYYGAADAMNTFYLYEFLKDLIDKQDPDRRQGPWGIYKIEKRCMFVTMEMEHNYIKIDREYLKGLKVDLESRSKECVQKIWEIAGRQFDVASPKQLGTVLFDELKLRYPVKEKTKTEGYQTSETVLEKIQKDHPIIEYILDYRGYQKYLTTYIDNLLENSDENAEIKFELNQTRADTGRYSATGGQGLKKDGYSKVNCQNLPRTRKKDPKAVDIRKAFIAHDGFKIVTIDYSGEELRIAANLSREEKWINEFLHGSGDLHTITARIIYGKNEVDKDERNCGKTLNFLTLYGGGPGGFSAQAKISIDKAKKMIYNFFKQYVGIRRWIESEVKVCRKRGYSRTAFGRRRPLIGFYNSTDEANQKKGDRCAINSEVQGCLQPQEKCLTDKGYIPIYEIKNRKEKGESFKVWTGTSWEDFDVLDRGKCQFAEIELENGMILNCDTRHQVLTVGKEGYEFRFFDELTEDTDVCVSIPKEMEFGEYPGVNFYSGGEANNSKHIKIKSKEQWNFVAFLIGVVIGDGWLREETLSSHRNSIAISFGKKDFSTYFDKLKKGIKNLGINLGAVRRMRGSKGESYSAQISSKALVTLFKSLGYMPAIARTKRVPKDVFTWPLSMRREFIKGYFITDGCKNRGNKYGYHTPNRNLLLDVQLLMWTIGIPSRVNYFKSDDTYKLECQSLKNAEDILNLPKTVYLKRYNGNQNHLPDFLRKDVYNALDNTNYRKSINDRSYKCKICSTKKNVALIGVLDLLKKYNVSIDKEVYYSYKLKRKAILDKIDNTYTLAVNSPLHRFDSAGIISKNTGSDVIKVALHRVSKWIREQDLQEKIKILVPIHDEIVYEIKNDGSEVDKAAFGYYIEELSKIMIIDDVITSLKWPVHLEVDAEYGDSFSVDQDYFKEKKELKNNPTNIEDLKNTNGDQKVEKQEVNQKEVTIQNQVKTISNSDNIDILTIQHPTDHSTNFQFEAKIRSKILGEDDLSLAKEILLQRMQEEARDIDPNIAQHPNLKDLIDSKNYLTWTISCFDTVVAMQIAIASSLLDKFSDMFLGPKCFIKLVDKDGEVLYTSPKRVSVDAFVSLCLWLNI
jgi:DNA polymerase I-like protein with 3'-5' exonuclease and polymerase domains